MTDERGLSDDPPTPPSAKRKATVFAPKETHGLVHCTARTVYHVGRPTLARPTVLTFWLRMPPVIVAPVPGEEIMLGPGTPGPCREADERLRRGSWDQQRTAARVPVSLSNSQ